MFENEQAIFAELNRCLNREGLHLTVICAGGFVLSHYGMRATHDIDGFYQATEKIESIIKEVGDTFHINTEDELWLNNSVQNLNSPPPAEICKTLYRFSNLTILIPPLDYIAGMKLCSARVQDIEDAASILKKEKIISPESLLSKCRRYGLGPVDESVLLEAFGIAYGMDWLEKYYIEHEEEINRRISQSL